MYRSHQLSSYTVASTSYHQPPSSSPGIRTRLPPRTSAAIDRRSGLADLSQDIYIPESQEEQHRVSIESRLLQPSGPSQNPDMRRADLTTASSTFDTYDRIGREQDFASARPTATTSARGSNMPAAAASRRHQMMEVDADESLIPGVGRGVRSALPSQTSYQDRLRSLNHHAPQSSPSPAKSPYRPGKYSSRYAAASQPRQPMPSSSFHPSARPAQMPRQAQVASESESEGDSASDSADSDGINVNTATFNSTGNHRNFAATPKGHTVTMTANFRQRPTLGQDTLDRIDFDIHTDTDGEHRPRTNSRDARTTGQVPQATKLRPDPAGPFTSQNTLGINAADYQQHLASRTLTSPAIRTLVGDRSKSPDSPTPTSSIDGILHAGKKHQQPRPTRGNSVSAVSAFEDLARRLQRDVELTRTAAPVGGGEEMVDDGSASNSGGSGFGPGSQASSARTRVDTDSAPNKPFDPSQFNSNGFPKPVPAHETASPWEVRLPDVTGLTSALGSPVKARDGVKHRPFDGNVGNQEARMEELVNLRCFVDGIQVELDRAGERILNLEQGQELQSQEFQGLRAEMHSALKDVRGASQGETRSEEQLVQLILQQLRSSGAETQSQQQKERVQKVHREAEVQAQMPAAQAEKTRAPHQQEQGRSHVEVVNRLYSELEKLRTAMEEQYRTATGAETDARASRVQHAAYRHEDNFPRGRDPWEAIEALRLQVLSLAEEVEGLNGVVLGHLLPAQTTERRRKSRTSAHRQRVEYEDMHPASDPVHPVRRSPARYTRGTDDVRTDPIDHPEDDHEQRRVSFQRRRDHNAEMDDEDEYDRTIDAIAENVRLQRERQRRRRSSPPPEEAPEMDDYEISQLASCRAARATQLASSHSFHSHDPTSCTVCTASARSDKRKASRRARLLAAEQRRSAIELEESILLTTPTRTLGQPELTTLKQILQEHYDEFLHQRMLYSELADELKTVSPSMSKTKRTILAQHVLEAVELLEVKADRINRLEGVIKGGEEGREEEKVRKEAGSRSGSSGGNRLKEAMDSFERRSRSSPRTTAGGRNSPPTTIQL